MTAIDTWIANLRQYLSANTSQPIISDIGNVVIPALQYINGIVSVGATLDVKGFTIAGATHIIVPTGNICIRGFKNTSGGAITIFIPGATGSGQIIKCTDTAFNAGTSAWTTETEDGSLIAGQASIKTQVNGGGFAIFDCPTLTPFGWQFLP